MVTDERHPRHYPIVNKFQVALVLLTVHEAILSIIGAPDRRETPPIGQSISIETGHLRSPKSKPRRLRRPEAYQEGTEPSARSPPSSRPSPSRYLASYAAKRAKRDGTS